MNNYNIPSNSPSGGRQHTYDSTTPSEHSNNSQHKSHTPPLPSNGYGPQHRIDSSSFHPYQPKQPAEQNFKEKNRAMYTSTMQFSNYSSPVNLGAMGRFVNENKEKDSRQEAFGESSKPQQQKHQFFNKYAMDKPPSDKFAGIVKPSNHLNQNQFDRFPAFNLKPPQTNPVTTNTQPIESEKQSQQGPIQTAEQKRKRQILQIKQQLDELNKKMQERTKANKMTSFPNVENMSDKTRQHSQISKSMIFQTQYSAPSQSFGTSKFVPQPGSSFPSNKLSIDQLYAQKKKEEHPRKYSNEDAKFSFENSKDSLLKPALPSSFSKQPQNHLSSSNTQELKPASSYGADTRPSTTQSYKPTLDFNKVSNNNSKNNKQSSTHTTQFKHYTHSNLVHIGYGGTSSSNYPNQSQNGYQKYQSSDNNDPGQAQAAFKKKKDTVAVTQPYQPKTQVQEPSKPMESPFKRRPSVDIQIPLEESSTLKVFKKSDFHIGKKMGKGQFGEVLLVRHKETGFLCGMKVMEKKQIRQENYINQIARELSIQFYLSHRNIAPLYGYFSDEKYVYLLVQFCTGGQLLEKLRGERRMNERDVALIIKQVCEGVDYIHKQLIIHRDIKPENILFNFGSVKISDFGWAVYRGFGLRKTASGSPLYYPPEIVKGESYDDKIDVWNIGMMTYECLLGKIPFRIYTQMDLDRIVSDDITFPEYVDVTDEAKDFILKTMRKKGDERMEIRQMLRHPFITRQEEKTISSSVMEQFKRIVG